MPSRRDAALARRHLDARLTAATPVGQLARPPQGWIKAIRGALGMSAAQLGRRLGITQPSVVELEQSEASGRIKLETLQRVAAALDCRLVYALIPRQPLEAMVRDRALRLAEQQLSAVEHSIRLEDQAVDDREARRRRLEELADGVDRRVLWDAP